jgi:hypothetical protein
MSVRTTITLEDDVYNRIREESAKSSKSVKEVINDAIRSGLSAPKGKRTFGVTPRDLGFLPGLNYDKISDLLDYIDGRDRKW